MEILDVVDENNNLTGEKADRKTVHEKGLWHREISIYIMNEKNEILIQKRAENKKLCPNKWALCEGHIDSGEDEKDAAMRELQEEVGLKIRKDELINIGIQKSSKTRDKIINNKFKYIYLVKTNKKLEDYIIQYEELSELKYMSVNELIEIINNKNEDYIFCSSKEMLEFLQNINKYI